MLGKEGEEEELHQRGGGGYANSGEGEDLRA